MGNFAPILGSFSVMALLVSIIVLIAPGMTGKIINKQIRRKPVAKFVTLPAFIFFVIALAITPDQPTPGKQVAKKVEASAPSRPEASGAAGDDSVLKGKEAGAAMSKYIGQVQSAMALQDAARQIQMSQIKQAIQFRNLDAYKQAAQALKESTIKAREEITSIQPPDVSEADDAFVGRVYESFQDLMDIQVDLAVDIAAQADTGMDMLTSSEVADLKTRKAKAGGKLKASVRAAYNHFGYKPTEIDMRTLQIKEGN